MKLTRQRRGRPSPLVVTVCVISALATSANTGMSPWAGPPELSGHAIARSDSAWALLLRGALEPADELARAVLRDDPHNARAALVVAEAGLRLGRGTDVRRELAELEAGGHDAPAAILIAGKVAQLERELVEARSAYESARDRYIARGESVHASTARLELASVLRDAGLWREAEPLFRDALDAAVRGGHPIAATAARYGLGYCLIGQGRNAEAADHARAALEEAQRLDLPLFVGENEYLLSVLAWFDLDLDRVIEHEKAAIVAYERAAHSLRQATMLRQLAATQGRRSEIPAAIASLARAESLARSAGDEREATICLEHRGSMHHALGDDELALAEWRGALRAGGDLWPAEWRIGTLLNISDVLAERGDLGGALAALEEAAAGLGETENQRERAEILTRGARIMRREGRIDLAAKRLDMARDHARRWKMPLFEAWALAERGECELARRQLDAAGRAFEGARDIARGRGLVEVDLAVESGLGRVARARGDSERALVYFQSAMETAESARRRSREATRVQQAIFGRSTELYHETVDLLFEMHRRTPGKGFDHRAFEVAERAKARSFLDLLEESRQDLRPRTGEQIRRDEKEILDRMRKLLSAAETGPSPDLEIALKRLEDELDLVEASIRTSDPRFAEIRYPRPVTSADVQSSALGVDELLVAFFLGDRTGYAWAITHDGVRMASLPGRDEIERESRALLQLLSDYNLMGPSPAYFVAPARSLFQTLFSSFEPEIARARHLVIASDGILHYVPFEVLLTADTPAATAPGFAALPYLVRDVDITRVPSVSVLAHLRRVSRDDDRAPPARELLFVGNPRNTSSTRGHRTALPHAREELASVQQHHRGGAAVVLWENEATAAGLHTATDAAAFRHIHVAAHGLFNERRPQFSGLLLTPEADDDDGLLTAFDVAVLRLDCDVVVLSACESALGEVITGEGLVGLTRAFLYAGARNVVASLWNVSGPGAVRLAGALYDELDRDPAAAGALARAQRRLLRDPDSAHPFYWAPFVLTGEGRRRL